jgi:hypothetical protein
MCDAEMPMGPTHLINVWQPTPRDPMEIVAICGDHGEPPGHNPVENRRWYNETALRFYEDQMSPAPAVGGSEQGE